MHLSVDERYESSNTVSPSPRSYPNPCIALSSIYLFFSWIHINSYVFYFLLFGNCCLNFCFRLISFELNWIEWLVAQLEEIRQKRAAERLSKASSGPDLSTVPSTSGQKQSLSCFRLFLCAIAISAMNTIFLFLLIFVFLSIIRNCGNEQVGERY